MRIGKQLLHVTQVNHATVRNISMQGSKYLQKKEKIKADIFLRTGRQIKFNIS
jgi:hypothetical protein